MTDILKQAVVPNGIYYFTLRITFIRNDFFFFSLNASHLDRGCRVDSIAVPLFENRGKVMLSSGVGGGRLINKNHDQFTLLDKLSECGGF